MGSIAPVLHSSFIVSSQRDNCVVTCFFFSFHRRRLLSGTLMQLLLSACEVCPVGCCRFMITSLWFCQVKRDCAGEFKNNSLPLIDCSWIYPDESHPSGLCKLSKFPAPWPAKQLASGGKNFQFVYIFLVQWCRITVVSPTR